MTIEGRCGAVLTFVVPLYGLILSPKYAYDPDKARSLMAAAYSPCSRQG
jgi:hypothetical protein